MAFLLAAALAPKLAQSVGDQQRRCLVPHDLLERLITQPKEVGGALHLLALEILHKLRVLRPRALPRQLPCLSNQLGGRKAAKALGIHALHPVTGF